MSEVKRMAELLKSGATMLSEICPECGTPLFRVGSDIQCPKCNKPVIIVKAAGEESRILGQKVLDSVEETLFAKIQEVNMAMKNENDPARLTELGNTLSSWLGALERIRRLRPVA